MAILRLVMWVIPLIWWFSFGKCSGIPECFPTLNKTGRSQSRIPVLSRDRKEDVPECMGREISHIFLGKIWFPGNGILERRPLVPLYLPVLDKWRRETLTHPECFQWWKFFQLFCSCCCCRCCYWRHHEHFVQAWSHQSGIQQHLAEVNFRI